MNSQRQIPAQKEFVFLIHGTNAGDESDEGGRWWQRGSAFWSRFAELLGPNFECQPAGQVFHWSGANSETYRRIAAEDLARWLTRFEEEKRPYHLIGHSHGGSVIWLALRKVINKRGSVAYLRSWATIGTPFLHYKSTALSRWWTLPAVASLLCVASSIPLVLSYFRVLGVVVRNPSGWSASVLLLPVMWLLLLVMTALGPVLLLAAANVRFRDVRHVAAPALQALLFLSPVAYAATDLSGAARVLYACNPAVGALEMGRWVLVGASPPGPTTLVSVGVATGLTAIGVLVFHRSSASFADVI